MHVEAHERSDFQLHQPSRQPAERAAHRPPSCEFHHRHNSQNGTGSIAFQHFGPGTLAMAKCLHCVGTACALRAYCARRG